MMVLIKAANWLREPLHGAAFCIYTLALLSFIEMVYQP